MDLPDDISKRRPNGNKKSIEEMKEDIRRREALNRVNNKYAQDFSQKPVEELDRMKLVIPSETSS